MTAPDDIIAADYDERLEDLIEWLDAVENVTLEDVDESPLQSAEGSLIHWYRSTQTSGGTSGLLLEHPIPAQTASHHRR
jgi:hypothetical protein